MQGLAFFNAPSTKAKEEKKDVEAKKLDFKYRIRMTTIGYKYLTSDAAGAKAAEYQKLDENKYITPAIYHPGCAFAANGSRIDKDARGTGKGVFAPSADNKYVLQTIHCPAAKPGLPTLTGEDVVAKYLYGLTYVRGGANFLDCGLYPEEFCDVLHDAGLPLTVLEVKFDDGSPSEYYANDETAKLASAACGLDVKKHWFFSDDDEITMFKLIGMNICAKSAQERALALRKRKDEDGSSAPTQMRSERGRPSGRGRPAQR